jgi:5-methyltetrahydropteroyltriglutamate--homocysteine methyltransferase
LIGRINKAARHFPLENLALSPQCGFASTMEGNLLTEDQQWAKPRLVADTSRRVWILVFVFWLLIKGAEPKQIL